VSHPLVEPESAARAQGMLDKARLLRAVRPAMVVQLLRMTALACAARARAGRSPFSPTYADRHPHLLAGEPAGGARPDAPYLRPTQECDSHAAPIVALARDLRRGAASDWEYAQSLFRFMTDEIVHGLESAPRDGVVGTLRRGYGICLDKLHLFVALARAGGLPARYCALRVDMRARRLANLMAEGPPLFRIYARAFERLEREGDPGLRKLGTAARALVRHMESRIGKRGLEWDLTFHPIAEIDVGGVWIPTDPTLEQDIAAAFKLPLPRLGYVPMVLRLHAWVARRSEGLPLGRDARAARWLVSRLGRGAIDYLNETLAEGRREGRRRLADIGTAEYVWRYRHFYVPAADLSPAGVSLPRVPAS